MNDEIKKRLLKLQDNSLLTWQEEQKLLEYGPATPSALEIQLLKQGHIPLRYLRNIPSIDADDQQRLLQAGVAVIGCGGLGGYVIEELARLGVGCITAWDHDRIEEHNFNRQILADIKTISHYKVELAAARVARVNPVVAFKGYRERFQTSGNEAQLAGHDVVVDALDSVTDRLELAALCRSLGLPLVHGAVQGWYGQVTTQFPGERTIEQIYSLPGHCEPINLDPSVLAFTPAMVATLQAAEAVKILLNCGELLRKRVLFIDLLAMDFEIMELPG